ncbi:MAG: EamA family transporter [Burkholderiales bacterium PBB4]|nr:MAG: EamA family transporter [Burkholderiales bacterium PBB4]
MTATPHAKPWLVDFILLAAIWGASFLFTRIGVGEFGALATAALRVSIASLFLLPLALAQGHGPQLLAHWQRAAVVGLLNSAIPFVCFAYALLSISSGLSAILNATVPLFGAVVARAWLKDRPTGSRTLGLVIGFVGVALLAWKKSSFTASADGVATGWAVLACLLACLCYGLAASFTKRYMAGLPSLVSATGSQLSATVLLLPLGIWVWPSQAVSLGAWAAVLALGVLCTGVAYILYFRIIERAGPAKALTVTFAIPVFAVLYGVLLLGEEVTPWMVGCGLVIIAGTTLSTGLVVFRRHPR